MGLLDDAIREHLDLQRRRGADPSEVERAEREALGPVRRAPEGQTAADLESDFAYDQEAEDSEGWNNGSVQESGVQDEPGVDDRPIADDDPLEPVTHEPLVPEEPLGEDEPLGHDEALGAFDHDDDPEYDDPLATTPPPHPAGGAETAEYDVEKALDSEHESGTHADDDVLEETPEFLQDTPDHDRLWFEQRPPKDFDFDG